MDKWEFILRNDRELSRAAADIALRQLDDIILHEIQSERESIREWDSLLATFLIDH